jgi:putative flippase GtrA
VITEIRGVARAPIRFNPAGLAAFRLIRFAGTGIAAAALQMAVLASLIHAGASAHPANVVAFLVAAQLNFALSYTFTWRERRGGSLVRRWLLYHTSIALMALVNLAVFTLASSLIPGHDGTYIAALLGIAAGGLGNYLLGDRLVFRLAQPPRTSAEIMESVA